jgi:hypothetical protein
LHDDLLGDGQIKSTCSFDAVTTPRKLKIRQLLHCESKIAISPGDLCRQSGYVGDTRKAATFLPAEFR